jgi:predicted PurR-regulated permease PerM
MTKKYPFYFKSTVVLFGLILFTYGLFTLRGTLVPLAFSLLLAILLNPLTSWLQSKRIPHVAAITISILIAILVLGGILYFISSQLASFQSEMPLLKKRFTELLAQSQQWVKQYFKISMLQQQQYIGNAEASIKPVIASTLGDVLGSLTATFLLPVYTFLLLFYKKIILNFLFEVFEDEDPKEVGIIIQQTKGAIQGYMVGLLLEGLIVATLNSVALLLLGVKYAILLGVIGAILNVLPFIGGILAVIFPLIIATVTKDGVHTQIFIVVAYLIIQFIDNHYLVPVIVSSRVKINALVSIIIVLLGGALWGVAGMFLSIPFIGVIKIVFDRVPELQPWGRLLGTDQPSPSKSKGISKD